MEGPPGFHNPYISYVTNYTVAQIPTQPREWSDADRDVDMLTITSSSGSEDSSSSITMEPQGRDWNREFQMYLLEPDPNVKYRKLSKLAKDFVSVAEEYGR
jgi:hypothetical protein